MDLNHEINNLSTYLSDRNITTPTENGYQINTVALDMYYSKSEQVNNRVSYTATGTSYVTTVNTETFMQTSKVVSIDTLTAQAQVTQPDPRKPFKCNFSFDFKLGVKIKLPDLSAPPPNFDLLYSIYNFTQEVEKINETLIYALKEMKCCDLEEAYNKTIIPFFRWFADHEDIKYCSYSADAEQNCGPMKSGDTFPQTMYNLAKTLVQLYIVVRPLICLLRPVPGNPWFPFDFDQVYFIRFIITIFDLYYDLIISGRLFDAVFTNPTRKLRQLLEVCIYGDTALAALDLNLSVIEYNAILGQLDIINSKINGQKAILDKALKEFLTYYNATIVFDIIKTSDKNLFENTSELIAANLGYNTNTRITKSFSVSEFFCLDKYKNWDNSSPSCENFEGKICDDTNVLIFLWNSDIEITYTIMVGNEKIISNKFTCHKDTKDLDRLTFSIKLKNDIENYYNEKVIDKYIKVEGAKQALQLLEKQKKILTEQLAARETAKQANSLKYDNSIMSRDFLTKSSINKMANNNSICDCFISIGELILDTDFKIPLPETIKSFTKDGFSNVQGKESFRITFGDMKNDVVKPYYNLCIKSLKVTNDDVKDKGIFYCDNFIDTFVEQVQSEIKKISPTINFQTDKFLLGLGAPNDNIVGDSQIFINALKDKNLIDNILIQNSLAYNYAYALNEVFGQDLKLLFTIKTVDKTIKFPDGNTSISIKVYRYSRDYFPTDVYPGNFGLFLLSLQKFNQRLDNIVTELKRYYLEIKQIDYTNWLTFKKELDKLLSEAAEKLANPFDLAEEDSLYTLTERQNALKHLRSLVGLQYPPFEVKFTENPFGAVWDIDEDYSFNLDQIYHAYEYLNDYYNDSNDEKVTNLLKLLKTFYDKRKEAINSESVLSQFKENYTSIKDVKYPIIQYFYLDRLRSDLYGFIQDEDVVTDWVWEKPDIPCTCDGIICKIIQNIINMILGFLAQFIQRFFNYLLDLFWKSPIGKLIKFIIAKLKCIMMLINIKDDLQKLEELVDLLKEGLKNNVKLYTEPSICLNQALNETTPDFPIQFDPETNTVTYPDIITPAEIPNNLYDRPSITGPDIDDPSYTFPTVNINKNTDGSVTITTQGGDVPEPLAPDYSTNNGYQVNFLPAVLKLTPQIIVGAPISYPNHKFPLLVFDCECDDTCLICNDETKVETAEVLNS